MPRSRRPPSLLARLALLATVAPLLAGTRAAAQPSAIAPIAPIALEPLGDGVYAVTRPNRPDTFADGNNLVVVNDEDVIVVDANITAASTEAVVAAIRRVTPKPVRYVVGTHWHDDHQVGNRVYEAAYPGVDFIGHPNARRDLIEQSMPAVQKNIVEYPKLAAGIEERLRTGRRRDGTPMNAQDSARAVRTAAIYRDYVPELRAMRFVPSTVTVDHELTLHRHIGGREREIRLLHLGRGNTRGDLVVHLPRERIVATGDLLVLPVPFSFGSYLGDWHATLGRLRALDAATIVPGHGPVQHDWSHLDLVRELIAATLSQTRDAAARGLSLDDARKSVRLDAWRDRLAKGDSLLALAFDGFWVQPATERAYAEAKGELK